MEAPTMNVASARNRRRALRRHARRLRLRVNYIQHAVADVRADVIEVWIAATRANAGRLPAGLVPDAAFAAIENAILLPWRLIPSVPMLNPFGVTRAMSGQGAIALGKEIAQNDMLMILSLGQVQIEQRKFSKITDVFAELDELDRQERSC